MEFKGPGDSPEDDHLLKLLHVGAGLALKINEDRVKAGETGLSPEDFATRLRRHADLARPLGTLLKRNVREAWVQDVVMNPCWGRNGPDGQPVEISVR